MFGWIIFWIYGVGAAAMVIAAFLLIRLCAWLIRLAKGFYLAARYRVKFGEWPEVVSKTKTGFEVRR